ncbi:MAG: hypothetical protein DCF22_24055 [Leptolyngbya sp.]|nr:MAG: hypothetical protein DCF22_24055 [Leptolyngbya sp.]
MNISLTKFCKDNDLPKSSVYRRCQELNISTADGLEAGDADRLLHEFDCISPVEEPAVTATVEIGNHQIVLAHPPLPQTYSLESLRSSEAVSMDDPLAVARQFLEVANHLTTAMKGDIAQREQRLDETRKAKDAIDAKAAELRLESRLYQLQTSVLDKSVTAETTALQEALAQLQTLGKSPSSC